MQTVIPPSPPLADRELRRALVAAGMIIPGTRELYEPAWVRALPCLHLDDVGRRAATTRQRTRDLDRDRDQPRRARRDEDDRW